MSESMATPRPWKIIDYADERRGGYIEIRGPNDEAIATIFPHAGKGGVGVETARMNAALIVRLVSLPADVLLPPPQDEA
jgi:hypothetical protein